MQEKWRLAKYLIDAKKAVDNILYISQHINELYDVKSLMYDRKSRYYINVCAVFDNSVLDGKKPIEKKAIKDANPIMKAMYGQRDKYYAHKDKNYDNTFPYASLEEEGKTYVKNLEWVLSFCKIYLPDNITLDFVYYDAELFRWIEKITKQDEERINKKKYPFRDEMLSGMEAIGPFKILYDIEDLYRLSDEEKKEYITTCYNGLTFEEGLQNRQDFCIRSNCLYDLDMWVSINKENRDELRILYELEILDKFDVFNVDKYIQCLKQGKLEYDNLDMKWIKRTSTRSFRKMIQDTYREYFESILMEAYK